MKIKRRWNFIKEYFVSVYSPYIHIQHHMPKLFFETIFVALKHRERKAIRFIIESIKLYFESYFLVLSFVFLIMVLMWPNIFIEGFYLMLATCFTLVSCLVFLRPWRWKRHVPPKRQLTFMGLHGVISQKIKLFINTVLRSSIPTSKFIYFSRKWMNFTDFISTFWDRVMWGGKPVENYLTRVSTCFNWSRIAVACGQRRASVRTGPALCVSCQWICIRYKAERWPFGERNL
jgi:hypothetical protein